MKQPLILFYCTNLLLTTGYASAEVMPSSISEGEIGFEVKHAQSNNIYKNNNKKESGHEQHATLSASYNNQTTTNNTLIDYGLHYANYSKSDIEDELNIIGRSVINQQLFSKNIQLDLSHFRHSYLLDQTQADLPDNNGNRDVFTASPLWRLPYSKRAGFDTRYTYTAVRFSDDERQETDRNSISIGWYHAINNKTTYHLNNQYSEVEFLFSNVSYKKINIDMSLAGRLKAGDYSIRAGYNQLTAFNRTEDGGMFEIVYNYRLQKNTLSLSAQRELTDSSIGLGLDTPDNSDTKFDGTKLLWIDRFSLDHGFFASNGRLINNNSIYYQQETPLATREVERRGGINTELKWKHSTFLSTELRLNYNRSELDINTNKITIRTSLSSSYRFSSKLFFIFTAQFEDEETIKNKQVSGYDEIRLIASINYQH